MALGVFLASYAPNLATFMFCYSFLFGTGIGLAYTAPMVNGWRWFPDRKGMVSGAVVAGFGAGGFVFNQVRIQGKRPRDAGRKRPQAWKETRNCFCVVLVVAELPHL